MKSSIHGGARGLDTLVHRSAREEVMRRAIELADKYLLKSDRSFASFEDDERPRRPSSDKIAGFLKGALIEAFSEPVDDIVLLDSDGDDALGSYLDADHRLKVDTKRTFSAMLTRHFEGHIRGAKLSEQFLKEMRNASTEAFGFGTGFTVGGSEPPARYRLIQRSFLYNYLAVAATGKDAVLRRLTSLIQCMNFVTPIAAAEHDPRQWIARVI